MTPFARQIMIAIDNHWLLYGIPPRFTDLLKLYPNPALVAPVLSWLREEGYLTPWQPGVPQEYRFTDKGKRWLEVQAKEAANA